MCRKFQLDIMINGRDIDVGGGGVGLKEKKKKMKKKMIPNKKKKKKKKKKIQKVICRKSFIFNEDSKKSNLKESLYHFFRNL